jgi:hypothetical protein
MQKISLALAQPGMCLAKPVTKDNGMVLVQEGVELTEAVLSRLESMCVKSIVVTGNAVPGASGGFNVEERIDRLDHLFRKYADDEWMMRIKSEMIAYFRKQAEQQSQDNDA